MAASHGAFGLVAPTLVDGIVRVIFYGKVDGVDEFLQVQETLKGPGTVGWWDEVIPQLDDSKRESLLAAAQDRRISHRTISVVLGQWGFGVKPGMVGHWRRNHVG